MRDATCESESHTLEGITGLQKKALQDSWDFWQALHTYMSSTRGTTVEPGEHEQVCSEMKPLPMRKRHIAIYSQRERRISTSRAEWFKWKQSLTLPCNSEWVPRHLLFLSPSKKE